MSGKLFLVPTPIGNLEDITHRAVRVLKEADTILAEDTRTSGKLLNHYGIESRMMAYHQHNEHVKTDEIIEQLKGNTQIALITDAGTPGISDPGFLLVRECIKYDIEVECLPGPTAFVPALVISGIPNNRFVFEGFLPHKKGRQSKLEELTRHNCAIVLYESPHRLNKTLAELSSIFSPEHAVSVSRELSKKFEETVRGTISEAIKHFEKRSPKGEFVIVVNPMVSK